ncbi:exodeoxyribonuclease VII large subunit [Echinicola jeungdonensis]|uniref:Exodeoxyribonuclease 7 large subunit n=1 Tax=Echinicola jeungdonensis TaxID=709343 RepID=A0ABV5J377_9BACT|nr:exodeoxyribonuclease VII large subunit [Echinicola jeungdonensis]MDN3668008.1 exodeoxyribonuclease VII large subunit [Echinicola jeungdonensis]
MQRPLSLFELNQLIQQTLDSHLEPVYWVIAEIGELRGSARGHAYLELVEKNDQQLIAKIRANIWAYTFRGISSRFTSITGQELKAGMKILAQISVQFHEIYGLSLIVKDIDPNFTLGEKARRRQEVIDRLTKEGLLELNKQFPLPKVPQKVAIISSSSAAGFGDFVNQVENNRHRYRIHWKLYQATLQGDRAVSSIIQAIHQIEEDQLNNRFDLLVIIRGGGAQIDLDCFDDYELARSIANTTLPVITGIGHERDETVADMVAHTKMKTPTAVAEFILSGLRDFEEQLEQYLKRMERTVALYLQKEDRYLLDQNHLLKQLFTHRLMQEREILQLKQFRIKSLSQNLVKIKASHLGHLEVNLKKDVKNLMARENLKLETLSNDLQKLNPQQILKKGYTRTEIEGKPINQVKLSKGDKITTFTLNQQIQSKIENIDPYES